MTVAGRLKSRLRSRKFSRQPDLTCMKNDSAGLSHQLIDFKSHTQVVDFSFSLGLYYYTLQLWTLIYYDYNPNKLCNDFALTVFKTCSLY